MGTKIEIKLVNGQEYFNGGEGWRSSSFLANLNNMNNRRDVVD
jgi:hypothetical protein